ncbi:MAG: hypothetical protein ACRDOB_16310 [Streptosporangiaceae bacterium]
MAWAIVLLPLLLLAACSQAAKPVPKPAPKPASAPVSEPAPPSVALGYCGSNLQVKPDVVLVVCGTDDITARNLLWSGWGTADATAKGSATVDLCAYNDCAAADLVSVPIRVTASKIVACNKNTKAYSKLHYTFPDGSPFQGVPTAASSQGLFQDEGIPPANQTVSLTC